ncbi:sugar ABC transporter permease [Bifidobacterium amazonense]|uniref:Sugar ABC transporter permease n=1 Tax=Bifidobacterium amazonense TaxID=2809027 RepID=A0ABS9VV84_9BIFI|nr:sugar ABC transporter permease [Bifidobacterium amazonense]MCH9275994.1 sugar ABC transporter permease [Bifidobacterium amazonense]
MADSTVAAPSGGPGARHVPWRILQAAKGASFVVPFFCGFVFFVITPIIMSFRVVAYNKQKSGLGLGEAKETFVGLANIVKAAGDTTFWVGFGRVALYGIIMVPLTQFLSMCMALLIDSVKARTAGKFRILLLLPYMTPGVVQTIIWIYLYSPTTSPFKWTGINFFDSNLVWFSMGQMAVWAGLGFNMLIMYGSLQSIPGEVIEAARLDGASEVRIAFSIKVPYMVSSVTFTTLFAVIGTLQLFDQPYFFRSISPQTITKDFTPAMMIYNQAFQVGNINYATALSLLLAAVLCVASIGVYVLQGKVNKV